LKQRDRLAIETALREARQAKEALETVGGTHHSAAAAIHAASRNIRFSDA
jgi:hypothetical protein